MDFFYPLISNYGPVSCRMFSDRLVLLMLTCFSSQIIRELREEVERLKSLLVAKTAGKPITEEMITGIAESPPKDRGEIEEMLVESEKLMQECSMSWEQKEKKTEQIQQVSDLIATPLILY